MRIVCKQKKMQNLQTERLKQKLKQQGDYEGNSISDLLTEASYCTDISFVNGLFQYR